MFIELVMPLLSILTQDYYDKNFYSCYKYSSEDNSELVTSSTSCTENHSFQNWKSLEILRLDRMKTDLTFYILDIYLWPSGVYSMNWGQEQSVQFSSVAQLCPTLCDPMNRSTPGLPVHHQLPEFTQTHVHRVSDAIQSSHPLSSPSPPAPNPSQHQSLFQWVNSSHEVAKILEFLL